ncbi:MAG: ATP-dependent helicase [Tissierellia bacterium]|nr:ATP-dependent helicase [Tissierellia bacterium]
MKLTKEQQLATKHMEGPALVLAVPGSGKTTMLIYRTLQLIQQGIAPNKILTITFSKASALDMKKRFLQMSQEKNIVFSTIHAFCYGILRDYGRIHGKKYLLLDSNPAKKYNLLRQIYQRINHTYCTEEKMETAFAEISYVKNRMINPQSFAKDRNCDTLNFDLLYADYERAKQMKNLIDFDDMITETYRILREDAYLRRKYRLQFDFIQIDEGQDTSYSQFQLIKLLVQPKNNLFIVADDDQSIYSFRGADPQGILNLKDEYPNLKTYYMEENFRSSKNIVNLSNYLIHKNETRFHKSLRTNNPYNSPVNLLKMKDAKDQYDYILQKIQERPEENHAILYRNNLTAIGLVEYFERNQMEFNLKDRRNKFFNHFIVTDLLNILNFADDLSQIELYETFYYKLKGYISKRHIAYLRSHPGKNIFSILLEYPGLPEYYKKNISRLAQDFKKLSHMNFSKTISFIEKDLGYGDYLMENCKRLGQTPITLMEYLYYLKLIAEEQNNSIAFVGRLKHLEFLLKKSQSPNSKVLFSTIHSAKGLEFDNVYIIDLMEGNLPSSKSLEEKSKDPSLLEEERRLFYVAMTRAKKNLYLLYPHYRNGQENLESRFLMELQEML